MHNHREILAEWAHNAWSGWQRYMFSKSKKNDDGTVTIPKGLVDRWERQMKTPYPELTPPEKESDRAEADEILDILASTGHSSDDQFVQSFDQMSRYVHQCARRKGFWDEGVRNWGELIALMHSELSEALEAVRHGNPDDDKIPDYSGLEAELADCVIRIMDAAAGTGLNVAGALAAKMEYNEGREYKHGKAF